MGRMLLGSGSMSHRTFSLVDRIFSLKPPRGGKKVLLATLVNTCGGMQVRGRVKDANLPKPTQVHLVSCMKEIGVKNLLQSLVQLVRSHVPGWAATTNSPALRTTRPDQRNRVVLYRLLQTRKVAVALSF